MPDMENILSSIEALCISILTDPTDIFNPFIAATALATLTDASDMLNANASASLFLAWQWVSPVICLASR